MSTTIEMECPHCEAPMECEYEMEQGERYSNMGMSCWTYWYLAWLDLPDACPEGCALTAEDKARLEERADKDLLETR